MQQKQVIQTDKRVIIVGSGVSGLTAAFNLQQNKFSVNILEARSVHGGRISKNTTFANFTLETGAEEIHVKKSRYFKMAKEAGAVMQSDSQYEHYIEDIPEIGQDIQKGNGVLIEDEKYFDEYKREDFYDSIMNDEENKKLKDDMSIQEYLKQKGDDERFLKLYEFIWGTEYGSTLQEMSIKGFAEHEQGWESDDDENFLITNMSHIDVIEKAYSSVLPYVQYNTPVAKIIIKEDKQGLIKPKVIVIDNQGREYEADHVIVSVPVTQLKNGSIQFEPPLPKEKQQAIDLLKMGVGGKLHMKFKERFWPEKLGSLTLRCGIGMVWNCSLNRAQSSNVLCALISGQVAMDMNDEVKRKALMSELFSKLQQIYKTDKSIENELFEDYIWTEYSTIKYIEGCYTYPSLNLGKHREILAKPIGNEIFFAGEASNPKYFATINGALDTGVREANRIIQLYKNK